ncbi:unnamed protein product [Pleuronectes platessa]|uniref:Uncharacterized protein n=1 Tax=Pleuronectes platessa TaxID=8262 RepID=A0A9N7TWL9_PLEPL|nr:unnamed protein product [Pleuronectes platessa]
MLNPLKLNNVIIYTDHNLSTADPRLQAHRPRPSERNSLVPHTEEAERPEKIKVLTSQVFRAPRLEWDGTVCTSQ